MIWQGEKSGFLFPLAFPVARDRSRLEMLRAYDFICSGSSCIWTIPFVEAKAIQPAMEGEPCCARFLSSFAHSLLVGLEPDSKRFLLSCEGILSIVCQSQLLVCSANVPTMPNLRSALEPKPEWDGVDGLDCTRPFFAWSTHSRKHLQY